MSLTPDRHPHRLDGRNAMVRNRVLAGALVLLLAGCQLPRVTAPGPEAPAGAKGNSIESQSPATTLRGRVEPLPARGDQAIPAEVMNASTIALIDSSGQTQATTITDAQGNFNLPMGSYSPSTALPGPGLYYLEAIHGLGSAAPGNEVGRFRTVLQWTGTGWLSCTNGAINQAVVINQFTTALAIERGLDAAIPIANLINKVKTTTPIGLNAAPAVTGHSDAEINNLAAEVLTSLQNNFDPVAKVPAIAPSVTSFSPASGPSNGLILITGNGFSPSTSGNTVTFTGSTTPAAVLAATPTQLVVVVPAGATTGTVKVATVRGQVTSVATFTVLASAGGAGGIYVDSFSPTTGRVGTVVTMVGSFGTQPATPDVYFATPAGYPTAQATVLSWSSTTMTVQVPFGCQAGPVTVAVGATRVLSSDWFDLWSGEVSQFDNLFQTAYGYSYTTPWSQNGYANATASIGGKLYYYQIGGGTNDYNLVQVYPVSSATNNIDRPRACQRLVTGRQHACAAVVGNWLYVFGGYTGALYLNDAERAQILPDGSLGPWQSQPNLLQTTRGGASAVVRTSTNIIYVLGGYNGTYLNSWEMFTVTPGTGAIVRSNTGTMYNNGASFTSAYGQAVLSGDGILYQCGYFNSSYAAVVTSFLIQSDDTLALGAQQTPPTYCHAYGQMAVIGSHVYLFNGYTSAVGYTAYVEHAVFNFAHATITGPWLTADTPACTLACAYKGPPLVTPNNVVWFTGGTNLGAQIMCAYVESDQSIRYWQYWGQTRHNWYGCIWLTIGRNIWRCGGYDGTAGTAAASTEYYGVDDDGYIGPAISGPDMTLQRYGPGWVRTTNLATNYLYAIGGGSTTPGGNTYSIERIALDDANGRLVPTPGWSQLTNAQMYRKVQWPEAIIVGQYLYVIGGNDPSFGQMKTIQRAVIKPDGTLSDMEMLPQQLPWSYYWGNVVRIGEYLYATGGYWNGSNNGWVLRAKIYPNGDLGSFYYDGTNLNNALYGAATNVIGNYLYLFGGNAGVSYGNRAFIKADGTLTSFSIYQPAGWNPLIGTSTGYWAGPLPTYNEHIYVMSGYSSGMYIQHATIR